MKKNYRKKKVTIIHNGFHGFHEVSFLAPANAKPGDKVEVSPTVAKRLNNEVCGIQGCKCGERVAHYVGYHVSGKKSGQAIWEIRLPKDGIMRGNYPQD